MSRDNLCIGFERDYEDCFPLACELFRKIIDNFDNLTPAECMRLYDIFKAVADEYPGESCLYYTDTFLV